VFDAIHIAALIRRGKRNRMTRGAGAPSATDAMHVVLRIVRKIIVNDELDAFYVNAPRGNVRRHKHTIFAVLESIKRFASLAERAVGVELGSGVAKRAHRGGDLFCAMFGA
jgi:hypothetical protein